jgi:AcrR family transcriptional regulator
VALLLVWARRRYRWWIGIQFAEALRMREQTPLREDRLPTFAASSRERMLQAAKRLFAARGFDDTSTAAIARAAGTSESQLVKHFGGKDGLLEAIFDEAWQKMNWSARQTLQKIGTPSDKLMILTGLIMTTLERDPELKLLLLLEGRRVRKGGEWVSLSQGFLDFVRLVDEILDGMRRAGQLRSGLRPQCVRSALMGMLEGLMRDQLLARRADYPAQYNSKEIRRVFYTAMASFVGANPAFVSPGTGSWG